MYSPLPLVLPGAALELVQMACGINEETRDCRLTRVYGPTSGYHAHVHGDAPTSLVLTMYGSPKVGSHTRD